MSGPTIPYSKPWICVSDQLAKLQSRGLIISDPKEAEFFLGHSNYYRFTGYCLAFKDGAANFQPGTTFSHVLHAYHFDASLRDLFTEALELIEIDLRTSVAYYFGKTYGAFGHTAPANFHPRFDFKTSHSQWHAKLHEETSRSQEQFVKHFRNKYREYPDLPVWTATEIMSFGCLSRMIGGMKKSDRQSIAAQYRLSARVLSSLTHHLVYVRNLCAHHCRLWDRDWAIKPELPNNANWRPPYHIPGDRAFATLLLMRQVLLRSPEIKTLADQWKGRTDALLLDMPKAKDADVLMGLCRNWSIHPSWQ